MHDSDRLVQKCNLEALLIWYIIPGTHLMELDMTMVTKWASIATVGISLGLPLPVPAFASPASSSTVIPSQALDSFQRGDLVRLRFGGPAMTVDSIKGNQADCFWTGEDCQPNAESVPIDVLQKL
jgi:uncharacterized protein YodC (DUF2158 family)